MNQPTASIQLLTGVLLFYGVRECFAFTKSLKSQPHKPKLVKEYVCPNASYAKPLWASMKKNADIKKMVVFVGNNDKKWG